MQIIIKIYFKCSIACCGKYSVYYDYFNKFFYVDYVTFCGVLWGVKKKLLFYMKYLYLLLFLQQILCNYD